MELKRTRIASTILLLLLCLLFYTSAFTVRHGDEHGNREAEVAVVPKPSLWEVLKNGLSLYTSSPLKVASYRDKFKSLTSQLHAYFFPPNLDFKVTMPSSSDEEGRVDQPSSPGGGGAGEKMKDAMSKSFKKSKETVEDTAKSAAKAVGKTVQKTNEKVKKSFSEPEL